MSPTRPRALRSLLAASAAAGLAAGCGGRGLPSQVAVPTDPTPLAKCQVAASQSSPLVTEWQATEKARLEGLLAQGGVAVRYSGCEMTLLEGCRLEGSYAFQRTTLSTDVLEIRNADELYAKLPLGAASLEGELRRSGRLAIRTTISGQMVFRGDPMRLPAGGTCAGATHMITAISIGAFKMLSGGVVGAGGGVELAGAGTGGKVSRAEEVLKEAGTPERCREAVEGAAQPDCSSPIQVFLVPLPEQPPTPAPAPQASAPPEPQLPPPPAPPPQGAPIQEVGPTPQWPPMQWAPPSQQQNAVYVRFPAAPEGKWTLEEGSGAALCQLPCALWLLRDRDYVLRRDGEGSSVNLPALAGVPGIQTEVELLPPRGSKVLGILGIAAGGASVIAGMALFLGGALEEMGPAPGLLVSTGGLGLTTGGIIYTVYSRSNYKPVYRTGAGDRSAPAPHVGIGPGGIAGAF
jgi:hypothetical protein